MTGRTAVTRRVAVGAALALTAGLGWMGTGAASAGTPLASCSVAGSMSFSPNLTIPNAPAVPPDTAGTLSGTLSNCKGKSGVKSGTFAVTMDLGQQSCISMIFPPRTLSTKAMTIKWKGGTTSVVNATLAVGTNSFSLIGPVTKNRFKGHKFNAPSLAPGAITPSNFHCKDDGNPVVPVQSIAFSGPATVN